MASAQRPFSAADTLALRTFGEVAAAPDGKTTVFSVATIDLPANKTVVRLMRISAAAALPTCSPACRKMPADPLITER